MKSISRVLTIVAAIAVLLTLVPSPARSAPKKETPLQPRVSADSAVLIDSKTGVIIFGKEAFRTRHPASLTKVLTAIVTCEKCTLQDVVTVREEATRVTGSTMGIRAGQKFTVDDLESANDAATALAVHVAGSIPEFADMQNAAASRLGAFSTHFVNPHGLTNYAHFTTAYDMALIARHALTIPFVADTVATKAAEVDRLDKGVVIKLQNTNKLLWHMEGVDGVKTGTTNAAGKSLIASATRGDHQLIAVVLHSDDRWKDAAQMLEYGFDNFTLVNPIKRGEVVRTARVRDGLSGRVKMVAASDLAALVPAKDAARVQVTQVSSVVTAPCHPGVRLEAVRLLLDGEELASVDLFPDHEVKERTLWRLIYTHAIHPFVRWVLSLPAFFGTGG